MQPSQVDELDQDDGDVLAGLHAPAASARSKRKKKSIFASVSDSESDGGGEGDEAPLGGRRAARRATGRDSGGRRRAAVLRDEAESEQEADEQRSPEPDLRLDVDYAPMDLGAELTPPPASTRQRKGTAVPSSSHQRALQSLEALATPGRSDSQVDQIIEDDDDDDDDGVVFSGFKRKKASSASAGGSKRTRR